MIRVRCFAVTAAGGDVYVLDIDGLSGGRFDTFAEALSAAQALDPKVPTDLPPVEFV